MDAKNINTEIYNELGERWYTAFDDPVALLRAQSKAMLPWVSQRIEKSSSILDVGCGGGFMSNPLALLGHKVTGIDLSPEALEIARQFDSTKSVSYKAANALDLPFPDQSFDVVLAMDFIEHVDNPKKLVEEISRVLKPGGRFFFHTFNRNFLSRLVVIHLVNFLIKNTPKNLHLYDLFVKPEELKVFCEQSGLIFNEVTGIGPKFSGIGLKDIFSRTVPKNFEFQFTNSQKISYLGWAEKI